MKPTRDPRRLYISVICSENGSTKSDGQPSCDNCHSSQQQLMPYKKEMLCGTCLAVTVTRFITLT